MSTRNFPQQGVVITPESDAAEDNISFNSDKSTVSGKLTIVDLPATHGRSNSDWDYEGIMTAGVTAFGSGWSSSVYFFGDITPTPVQVRGFNKTEEIYYVAGGTLLVMDFDAVNGSANEIEINGISYLLDNGNYYFEQDANLFEDGQTYTIKLR
jgi:hypothetical protein